MAEKSYEQSFAELEQIVQRLESGNVPLEDMIDLYEKGMSLYKVCADRLAEYEKRLQADKENNNA